MAATYELTDAERALLCDLLHQELMEIPSLIHHTHSGEDKDVFRGRQVLVEKLLKRLEVDASVMENQP